MIKQKKVLHPPGTTVVFCYSHYGRTNRHDGHLCRVVESWVKEYHGRNWYKYVLKDLEEANDSRFKVFKADDAPPESSVSLPWRVRFGDQVIGTNFKTYGDAEKCVRSYRRERAGVVKNSPAEFVIEDVY